MASTLAVVALFSTSGAHPELFGYRPVDSITTKPDEHGEVEWSTGDMVVGKGWRPTTYDEGLLRTLFGPPRQLSPDTVGWAFAYDEAPDHGVLLVPAGDGIAVAAQWDRGADDMDHWHHGWHLIPPTGSVWLNALADFQRDVLHAPSE